MVVSESDQNRIRDVKETLTVAEVAKLLFCSAQHVRRLHDRGMLPGMPIKDKEVGNGSLWKQRRFSTAVVKQFMIAHKVPMPIWMRNDEIDS